MTKAPTIKLNDNTIRLQLQALLSEIRTDGIETPLLDFFHFLQFVVPRESVFTKLYVEVGLVEYSHRTGEGSVSDEREIQEMEYIRAPSLRVIVWVGGGKGGAVGGSMAIEEAVTVVHPVCEDKIRWLARCARLAVDTTACMLGCRPLPTLLGADPKNFAVPLRPCATDHGKDSRIRALTFMTLDGANLASAPQQELSVSRKGKCVRFVSPDGPVLLVSNKVATAGTLGRFKVVTKTGRQRFEIAVIPDSTEVGSGSLPAHKSPVGLIQPYHADAAVGGEDVVEGTCKFRQ